MAVHRFHLAYPVFVSASAYADLEGGTAMTTGPSTTRASAHPPRRKPTREPSAFVTALFGLVIVLFSAAWVALWFGNVEGAPKLLGLTGVIILLSGAKIVWNAIRGGDARHAFVRAHSTTTGTVLDYHTETSEGEWAREKHYVTVRFDVDGVPWTLQAEVSETVYEACWRGRPLSVRYANADPHIALLEGEW
jgi:hypothetical protein